MGSTILAGDIGATKTILAIYHTEDNAESRLLAESTFRNKEFSDFTEIISTFLADQEQRPSRACFAVAGPVYENRVRLTNLSWNLDGPTLAQKFTLDDVRLVNDLVATTTGALHLTQQSMYTINTGNPVDRGNIGVLAVGTGLGQAFALPINFADDSLQAFPTEGGHTSFAPRNQEQMELLNYLLSPLERQEQPPHVSVEQVCSGMSLPALYAFQLTRCQEPEWMREKRLAAEGDALTPLIVAAAHADSAGERSCEPAIRAIHLMLDILAAEAANLALKFLATGGIFLGGGMLPRLLAHIDPKRFMTIFCRGVYQKMLSDIPIHIIMEPKTALLGARYLATKN